MFQLSGNMVSNPSRHGTTNRCCTNPKGAFRADRARGGTSRPTTRCGSEPDPIDDEFERALDQELDTIAEDDPEIAPAPVITHERSKREIDPSVADILREEAQREREQRAAETFEHQDEFALDADEPTSDPSPRKAGISIQSWTIWTKCTKIRHQMHQRPVVICCQISKK